MLWPSGPAYAGRLLRVTFGYSFEVLTAVSIGVGLSGFSKGVTGIGPPIIAIAVMIHFVDPQTAFVTMVIPNLITNIWQSATSHNWKEPFLRFWPMIVCFVISLFIGAVLLVTLDGSTLLTILGVFMAAFAAMNLINPREHPLSPTVERWTGPIAGTVGGLLGGLTAIWGPPMLMLFVLLKLDKETWIQTVGLIWFIGSVPLALAYWHNGLLNAQTAPLSAFACIAGMIGIWLGEAIRSKINQETFRKLLLVSLLLIGLNLVRGALF